jgi:HTH-type transcriptional regulator/antitoxin HigA
MMKYKLKPNKNEVDYATALDLMTSLMDASEDTPEADDRDVLALLITQYENEHYQIAKPDPLTAIRFRMEQAGLTQTDLIPYIGSRSKVSEVLSGKRELTLKMARALHQHLGIPAEALLGSVQANLDADPEWDFERFPVQEMLAWASKNLPNFVKDGPGLSEIKDKSEEWIRHFLSKLGGKEALPEGLFRMTASPRLSVKMDPYALRAWCLLVLAVAKEQVVVKPYHKENITDGFLQRLVGLSTFKEGPRLAQEHLSNQGISLVIVSPIKKIPIDGAAFFPKTGQPVIGMTLRFDRIDNFWFVLLHKLAHVVKHLEAGNLIADDMSMRGAQSDTDVEKEADKFAEEALLPADFDLHYDQFLSAHTIQDYADRHQISAAIVAGRIRYEKKNFRLFTNLIGHGEVKQLFEKG